MPQYVGGYLAMHTPIFTKRDNNKHTIGLKQKLPDIVLETIHQQQAIPYRCDTWMYHIQRELFTAKKPVPWSNPLYKELPKTIDSVIWNQMTPEEQKKHKRARHDVYKFNERNLQRRIQWAHVLEQMPNTKDHPIFFPQCMDWRGRIYPVSGDWVINGADYAASSIERYDGEVLTDDGFYWLAVGVGTEWGLDKRHFDERAKWAEDHLNVLREWVANPIDTVDGWGCADRPLKFLGLAHELVQVHENRNHQTHRVVSLDGTCNGFQHMAALLKDPDGAATVNLLPGPRQDVYQNVADEMNRLFATDGVPMRAERSHVKRGVMTTPYGVTHEGLLRQLKFIEEFPEEYDAFKFRDYLELAIKTVSGKAVSLMSWFKEVARLTSKQNLPLDWVTPNGMRIRQAYYKDTYKKLDVVVVKGCRYKATYDVHEEQQILRNKQVCSIAPNIIHSFDAAHLQRVCTHPDIDLNTPGMWPSTVHDSFGVLPNHVRKLGSILRETFVEMYSVDHIKRLYEEWVSLYPDLTIPEPPAQGSLDINKLLLSDFMFS